MNKSVAPTELIHNALLLYYKGNTPTELFPFSKQYKMDKAAISGDTPTELFGLLKQYRMDKAIIASFTQTRLFAFSKTEISSAKAQENRIWNSLFRIGNSTKNFITVIYNYIDDTIKVLLRRSKIFVINYKSSIISSVGAIQNCNALAGNGINKKVFFQKHSALADLEL